MPVLSKENCLSHYKWGDNCDGWNFICQPDAVVKQELMPANTSEKLHFHKKAQQFFFVLKGEAEFLIENKQIKVKPNEGLTIFPGDKHKIMNQGASDLEFILFSFPSTENDRTNCDED